ncbi:NSFL1 cofactor p47 [Seminavis robusta]|uniref:NSFL1 cofactor p47 n=1 Tax=Seminavis robusta TaxID=568900 RepID=A0A9N8DVZ4_9STRA|nr:NSFL1 cofactor p47 [Seminavis robusta]CAB9509751.1 NSFL1 cofactor p47 [Seminavis robusta]|eukprot:Sro156_g070600.1 NSFL1 cofactor p47 (249) ;mRNA; f:1773-2725
MANVHGLFSGDDNKEDEEEDNTNNRYVGGIGARGGGSGLAVEPNHDEEADPRDSVFSQAENVGPGGAGEEVRRTITMYRNGFIVDDGPYRRLDDPANAEFLRSLAQGVTPRELLSEGDVTVGLIDKRSEEYIEKFQSFSGAGASLGTKTTGEEGGSDTVDPATLPPQPPAVDASQPTTSIQVRLPNGKRKVVKINLSSSVTDLAAHLRDVASGRFRLLAGFPPAPITDLTQSVEAAGLKGASVSMQAA